MRSNLAGKMTANLSTLEFSSRLANACLEANGLDIVALSLKGLSDMFEYFVIATGRSDRQVQGICHKALEAAEKQGVTPLCIEGLEKAHWVVIDFGEVVLHVFYGPVREHYDLEGLWAKAKRLTLKKRSSKGEFRLLP